MKLDSINIEAKSLLEASSCYPHRLVLANLLEEDDIKPIIPTDEFNIFKNPNHCANFIKHLLAQFTMYDNYHQILTEKITNILSNTDQVSLKTILNIMTSPHNHSLSAAIEFWEDAIRKNSIVSNNATLIFEKFKTEFGDDIAFGYLNNPQIDDSKIDEIITFIKRKKENMKIEPIDRKTPLAKRALLRVEDEKKKIRQNRTPHARFQPQHLAHRK